MKPKRNLGAILCAISLMYLKQIYECHPLCQFSGVSKPLTEKLAEIQ